MKKIVILSLISFVVLALPSAAFAKRIVPQAQKAATGGTAKPASSSKGISTAVKFRGDRRGINVTFSNLSIASSVNYSLTYETQGTVQGVNGSIPLTSSSVNRDIIFGSCSTNNVCRYDSGVKNAKFIVTTVLKTGKKVVKTFKLKV